MAADIHPLHKGDHPSSPIHDALAPELESLMASIRKVDGEWKTRQQAHQNELAVYERERTEREGLIHQAGKRIQELAAVADQLRARVAAAENACRQLENKNSELTLRNESVQSEVNNLHQASASQARMHEQVIASWRSAVEQSRLKIEALEEQVRTTHDNGERSLRELKRDLRAVEDRLGEREKELSVERARLAYLDAEVRRLQSESDRLRMLLQQAAEQKAQPVLPPQPQILAVPAEISAQLATLQEQQKQRQAAFRLQQEHQRKLEAEVLRLRNALGERKAQTQAQPRTQPQAQVQPRTQPQAQVQPPRQQPQPPRPSTGASYRDMTEIERMRSAFLSHGPDSQTREEFDRIVSELRDWQPATHRGSEHSN